MHRKNSLGLRGKLILAMVAIGAIPMVLGLMVAYSKGTGQLRVIIGESFKALAMNSAAKIDSEIQRLIDDDKALAHRAVTDFPAVDASEKLTGGEGGLAWPPMHDEEKETVKFLLRSWITKPGEVLAHKKKQERLANPAGSGNTRVNLFHTGEEDRYVLDISVPVYKQAGGTIAGWLHRRYDANKFLDSIVYPIRFGDTGHVMLIDNHGIVMSCPLLSTGVSIANTGLVPRITQEAAGWIRAGKDGHGGEKDSLIGHASLKNINSYLRKDGKSLYTFAWQDSEELFAPVKTLQKGVILAGLTALCLLGILGFYAGTRIVDPIRRLSREAGHIAEGDLSRSIDIRSGDEIEELADQFNHMTSQLRQHVDNLEDKVEERTKDLIASQAEKEQVMKQLIQTEKVAAVGVMTSGIGHEINNPLYAILGRAEAIADGATPEKASEYGREIVGYCKHISSIIKDLAGYVRPHDEDALESVDVNKKIAEAVAMVKMPLLNDHVKIVEKCHDVPEITGQPQEIQQIFFNIIRNGVQAIEDKGTVEIESYLENNHVRVSIRDDGLGISEENLGKIFDPFFTTKGPDEGEGLGLHIVRKSVQKNGGDITVESNFGEGTVFNLTFPIGGN